MEVSPKEASPKEITSHLLFFLPIQSCTIMKCQTSSEVATTSPIARSQSTEEELTSALTATRWKRDIPNFLQSCLISPENSRDDSRVPAIPSSHPVAHGQLKSHRQATGMDMVSVSSSCSDHFTWAQLHFLLILHFCWWKHWWWGHSNPASEKPSSGWGCSQLEQAVL